MIIEALINLIYGVFSVLTSALKIPGMPEEVASFMNDFMQWLSVGFSIVASYTHINYLMTLFGIVIAVDVGIMLYHFIMWVIKKIPFLGIK